MITVCRKLDCCGFGRAENVIERIVYRRVCVQVSKCASSLLKNEKGEVYCTVY